jgi:PAS domain S-box-containing protein
MKIIKHDSSEDKIAKLREKLAEAEEVLSAIRSGRVDALMVSGSRGEMVYTLKGADYNYRILIETMTEGAVILTKEGLILYCNSRFAEMVKAPIEYVIGGSITDFIEVFEKNRFAAILRQAVAETIREEVCIYSKNGDPIPALLSLRPLSHGEMKSICMIVTDLTQQKKSEQKLKDNADELHNKNIELSMRAEQLSRLSSQLTLSEQFERRRLAKILHDHLQQLLVAAKIGVETIFSQRTAEEQQKQVKEIVGLLSESINASRSLTVELCPPILYESGLSQALEWLSSWMNEKYQFHVDLVVDKTAVPTNENMRILLFESVRELLFNVLKHAGVDSAQVELMREDEEYLKVIVSDEGTGFDSKKIDKNSYPNSGGFGLFSIRERLSLMGGWFELTSTLGKGTIVSLTAQCINEKRHEPELKKEHPLSSTNSQDINKKIRVMLVDDHAVMRQGLSSLLSLQSDIEIVGQASDGEEAVNLARKIIPDVILMDISMPKINGIEATRIIHSEFPDIRIIGLSMYTGNGQATAMINAGASAYQSKGDNTDLLIAAIRGVVFSETIKT